MIAIDVGPYLFRLKTTSRTVKAQTKQIYAPAEQSIKTSHQVYDIVLEPKSFLRQFIKPQVGFEFDGETPFHPLPKAQAYPLLEWGMNWCIAGNDFTRLVIHAGVAVKNGKAIIFPANPGSGKSTLCALLAGKGWTIYSDEVAIIELDTGLVNPIFRPICLKNNSIDIIKATNTARYISPPVSDTSKGTVAHAMFSERASFAQLKPVPICAVVFPKYDSETFLDIEVHDQLSAMAKLIKNAFNFNVVGEAGFHQISQLVLKAQLYSIQYGDIDEADAFLQELVE